MDGDGAVSKRRLRKSKLGVRYPLWLVGEALQLVKRGFTYSEVARRLGVSRSAVCSWCLKFGAVSVASRKLKGKWLLDRVDGIVFARTPLYCWIILWIVEAEELLRRAESLDISYPRETRYEEWRELWRRELKEAQRLLWEKINRLRREAPKHVKILRLEPHPGFKAPLRVEASGR